MSVTFALCRAPDLRDGPGRAPATDQALVSNAQGCAVFGAPCGPARVPPLLFFALPPRRAPCFFAQVTQDYLEFLFSTVRGAQGWNVNPTSVRLLEALAHRHVRVIDAQERGGCYKDREKRGANASGRPST
jgi:hypothetical protein